MNEQATATPVNEPVHTEGPWRAQNTASSNQALVYSETTGKDIAVLYDRRDKNIVAAAPEMLAALKALQEWSWAQPWPVREADVWREVDSAIANAEGK